ncbi:MAG: CapA family protein [Candidatus Daviesbacteria bacterium]|nr:CapA family protein [Candidatus Daviesbacteria bacterium]
MFKFLLLIFGLLLIILIWTSWENNLSSSTTKLISPFLTKTNYVQFEPKTITLEQIFSANHQLPKTADPKKIRTLIATGDVIPARSVNYQAVTRNNFNWVWEKTGNIIKNADITLINLESPLITNCPLTQEGMIFCGDKRNIAGLKFAGVDVANLANNHSGNYGQQGITEAVDLLNQTNILPAGINGPVYQNIRGLKFGFLGYNALEKINEEKVCQDIKEVKNKAQIIIVAFHWGTEYQAQPDEFQKNLAHKAIDCGVDLIIGNHPHWIQPVEIYHDKLITYAHGNFIFDQMWSEKTKEGVVGKYTFYDDKLIDVEFLPVKIENYGQPYFLEGQAKLQILDEMKLESLKLMN